VQAAPSRAFAIGHWVRHPFGRPPPLGPRLPNDHRDVRLFDDRISWTVGGVSHERALDHIGLVRLSGSPTFMCEIRFRNANGIRVFASDIDAYRKFVKDLHERLFFGALERGEIKFIYPRVSPLRGFYLSVLVVTLLAPLLVFGIGGRGRGPPAPGLLVPNPPRFFPLLGFISLCVAFGAAAKVVHLMTPIKYDPTALPDELLPGSDAAE
jgi:hypothetical protein